MVTATDGPDQTREEPGMGLFSRNTQQTPEEQWQAARDADWRETNADSLAGRARFADMSERQANRRYPLTEQTARIAGT